MAELGSTGGNLDNILQYLLQRIEKSGRAEGGTGGVARFANLSDVPAATSGKTQYWGWNGSAYAWLDAPGGGGGSDVDLSDYYTITQVNDLLKGYAKTNDLPDMSKYVFLETYNEGIGDVVAWATSEANRAAAAAQVNAIATANAYTDSKASATLSAANANAATIIEQALEAFTAETLSEYATITWADAKFAKLGETNRFTAYNYIKGRLYLSNGDYGLYFVCDNNESVYLYRHIGEQYDKTFLRMASYNDSTLIEFGEQWNPGAIKIGNAYITYDSKNNALIVSDGNGGAVNIVAMGDVAAFGGLGSGFDKLTDLTLTNKLTARDIYCSRNLTVDGKLECTGRLVTAYMSIDNVEIGSSITLSSDYIYLGLSEGAYIHYEDSDSKITDISADGSTYVYITINGMKYRLTASQVTNV